MAYSATVTVSPLTISGRRHYVVNIVETEAAAASEYNIPSYVIPQHGKVVSVKATLVSGSAASINPTGGLATGWAASTQNALWTGPGAAAHVAFAPPTVTGFFNQSTGLWVKSTVNAGADNVVHTQIMIVEGLN